MRGLHSHILGTVSLLTLAIAAPAHAQDNEAPAAAAPAAEQDGAAVVVTGSRIRRPNLEFDGADHLDHAARASSRAATPMSAKR